ncbi:dihydrodipicolinate synthase family protein [Clostridium autoethanogenum]|uniref:Dihydrodipicolinate synthase family protein n=1 Tax=Clostridium autoethanogenum DSM 10061 TaxID=1341692 RepID=A0ABM5NVN7_9CLOT|nr:dihydrodipicolinate synthase family protein [Clostridium autoethanogenum]AGY76609.1 dihydrodipicolinate synthase family protein [Clostridium autoethanogenum DSM 10061]ALU36765.1 Dihydrodipicolinate synthase [Clostridium autoethanogenum DSM 10061]OVY50545.1 putative 2-keto-3-deoxy-galactonate aldolase YagE [Clostridium autoethanogenum]
MFKGIFTPMITLFREDGTIDKENQSILVEKLISDGVDGILTLGSVGEFFNLSLEQKKDYVKFMSETVKGRTKLLVGTGNNDINQVIELNDYCKKCKVDAVLVITPYFFSLNEKYLYEYYSKVAKNTELPILLYNFPARTGTNLSADFLHKLVSDFENIVGIKDTTDSISNVRQYVEKVKSYRKDFSILSGFDEYLIPNLNCGGDGIVGGLTNVKGKFFVDTYNAFLNKNLTKLSNSQKKINTLMELYTLSDPFLVALKEAVILSLNLDANASLRNYSVKLDEKVKERIRNLIV